MTSREFVEELENSNKKILARMIEGSSATAQVDILAMLGIALKNELEATELAASWIPSTPELDVKLGLARQVGDEAKHYGLLAKRYAQLGGDIGKFDPREGGYSPLFGYLVGLPTSVERLAAGQFTREAIAQSRNDLFIAFLRKAGDDETADIYDDIIQPDEGYHHQLGRTMLLRYATTQELQEAARQACSQTLAISEMLRLRAAEKTGTYQIPGC